MARLHELVFGPEWLELLISFTLSYGSWFSPVVRYTRRPACGLWRRSWRAATRDYLQADMEALGPESLALVPPGLRQGYELAHGLGVPALAERVVVEHDANRG